MAAFTRILTSAFLFVFFLSGPARAQENAAPPQQTVTAEQGSERFDFADGLYARGMYDMAAAEYEKLRQEFPSHSRSGEALFRMAESLFFLKEDAKARPLYEQFSREYPDKAQAETANLRIAEILELSDSQDEALNHLAVLLQSPSPLIRNSALYLKGKILFEQKKSAEAKAAFETLVQAPAGSDNPFTAISAYYLGEIALKDADYSKALLQFEEARKSEKKDLQQLALLGQGQAAALSGDLEKARGLFLEAYESKAETGATEEAFYQYTKTLHDLKRDEESLAAIRGASAETASAHAVRFIEAAALTALTRHEEALKIYDTLLASPNLRPEEKETAELGKLETFLTMNRFEDALKAAEAMTQERAFFKDRWAYLRAEIFRRGGRPAEALPWLDRIASEFPDSPYLSQAALNRGYILYESGNASGARDAFDAFMKEHPDHAQTASTLKNRITLDIKLEDWPGAIQTSLTYLEHFGTQPEALEVEAQLASLYLQSGNHDAAVKTFESVIAKAPDSPNRGEWLFFLAYSRQLAGDLEDAVKIYSQVNKDGVSADLYGAALKNTGYCYVRLEKLSEAAAAYRRWITEVPDADAGPEIFLWLADHETKAGNGAAVQEIMEAFQKRPSAAASSQAIAYFLGEAGRLQKKPEEAAAHYKTAALDQGPFRVPALFGLALMESQNGRFDAAAEGFETVIREGSADNGLTLRARLELGKTYELQSRFLDAAKAYFAAGILYDDAATVPEALFKAGEMFAKAEKTGESEKAFGELLKRYPESPLAKQIPKQESSSGAA